MKALYEVTGLSKQALWKYRKRQQQQTEVCAQVVNQINKIRKHHKAMGCRRCTTQPIAAAEGSSSKLDLPMVSN
ncbi:MAG: hypothetical protein IPG01_08395 [Chitinophagaceae bacterium]|nr:hypothetical protein [Chitinophagaceae bacterium]